MTLGSIAGYFGGGIDDLISRVIDVLMAFPGILPAIALVAVLGPSLTNVVLALSVIGWVGYARLVRGQALRARLFDAPHLTIFPGLAIATLVLGFNFLGDGLRDQIDPKAKA
jgi:ABC-type dipeptide/oligopeptide/nickel transport system permease subunit